MRYLSDDEVTGMQGLGHIGEVYSGIDGNLYEWVEGVDAWGGSIGFWQGLSEGEGEEEQQATAPEPPPAEGAEPEAKPAMGPGRPGEIRTGPDGKKYRWVLGRDAQGKPTGFWRRLHPIGFRSRRPQRRPGQRQHQMRARAAGPRGAPRGGPRGGPRRRRPLLRRLLPIAKVASALIPGVGPAVAAGLTVAGRLTRPRGVSGDETLGALYQAPDGSLYQVQGLAADEFDGFAEGEELQGFAADDELDGFEANDELDGFAADDELDGFAADDELDGFAQDQELQGFSQTDDIQGFAEEDLQGLEQGYVREDVSGLEAYIPEKPPQTRWFVPRSESDGPWEPLW